MLDLHYVLANPEVVKAAITNKGVRGITPEDVDTIISLATMVKSSSSEAQVLRTKRNENAEKIQNASNEERATIIEEGKKIKEQLTGIETTLSEQEAQLFKLMSFLPGIPSADTPIGPDSSGNVEHHQWGNKPKFDFEPKNHVDLLTNLGLLDLERGNKVSGFRGYFLKGDGAMLQWAMLLYAMEFMQKKGYELVNPPIIVKEFSLFGTGHFPWGEQDIYAVGKPGVDETGKAIEDKMYLAGTSEVPLMGMYANETIDISKGPVKMVGMSPCYRNEVGSYSKDLRGIYRVHEFLKVEQVVLMEADDDKAEAMHQEMLRNTEEIQQGLGLHYRVLSMCTGDMGEPQYKKFDVETWMPGKNDYGETCSASNMRDFQCRRNNIRVVDAEGNKKFAYALNSTAVPLPRLLIALVENYQTKEGKIRIPEVLQKYMGKEVIG
ncbi:serine--tRNA ligase [bacterium]|nr:serine--tRNA ligase [bacterium]